MHRCEGGDREARTGILLRWSYPPPPPDPGEAVYVIHRPIHDVSFQVRLALEDGTPVIPKVSHVTSGRAFFLGLPAGRIREGGAPLVVAGVSWDPLKGEGRDSGHAVNPGL